jgi:hypothetical protein
MPLEEGIAHCELGRHRARAIERGSPISCRSRYGYLGIVPVASERRSNLRCSGRRGTV